MTAMTNSTNQVPVRKLVCVVVALLLVGFALPYLVQLYFRPVFIRAPLSPLSINLIRWFPAALLLAYVLELLVVTWVCGWLPIQTGRSSTKKTDARPQWLAGLKGVGAALLISLATIPWLPRIPIARVFPSAFVSCPFCPKTLLIFLVILLAIPIASEIVFRRIILEALSEHIGVVGAVIVSSFVFALVWPVFGTLFGLVLGIIISMLYIRTRSLLACISADIIATMSAGAYLIWHALTVVR
jgi:membrane protease YdiL (CAAX protease family)